MSGGYSSKAGWLSDVQQLDSYQSDCEAVRCISVENQIVSIVRYLFLFSKSLRGTAKLNKLQPYLWFFLFICN